MSGIHPGWPWFVRFPSPECGHVLVNVTLVAAVQPANAGIKKHYAQEDCYLESEPLAYVRYYDKGGEYVCGDDGEVAAQIAGALAALMASKAESK